MPISKLLKFPIGSYLMVRLDYMLICGDELEAKILRIIEMYMEDERRAIYRDTLNNPQNAADPNVEVDVTRDVWAAISHRLFKNDLYDQDMSENTLKRAIKSLKKKNFIRVRDKDLKRYEAPKYQINTEVVQEQLHLLGKLGKTEYQKLMVSKIDGIKNSSHQNMTLSGGQNLIPSSDSMGSKFDGNSRKVTLVESREESILPDCESASTVGALAPSLSESSLLGNESLEEISTPTEVPPQEIPAPPTQEAPSEPEPPQQQTLMAPTSQQSAKVETPAQGSRGRRRSGIPQLTLAGQHIIDLFDASKPVKRKTMLNADNINRANRISAVVDNDDDFTRAVQRMRDDPFLKANNIAIDFDFVDRKIEKFLTIVDQEREAERKKPPSDQKVAAPPAPVRSLVADSSSVAQIQAMRARKMAERAQSQGGR